MTTTPQVIDKIQNGQTTDEAFAAILYSCMNLMSTWEPIAFKGEDIEGVHQMRVALRRMRSVLTVFRKAIPREATDPVAATMSWAANALGPARDLDVFIEAVNALSGKIPLPAGEAKILAIAKEHQAKAYKDVRHMLEDGQYNNFKKDLLAWIKDKGWKKTPNAVVPKNKKKKIIDTYAVTVMENRLRRVLVDGSRMGQMSTEELHQLRIDCKKLRYATEFFSPLFNRKQMLDFTLSLKGLQDILGLMNDVTVMSGLLDKLVESATDDTELIQYAGALIGWRAREYEEMRGLLNERWEVFANSVHPWLKKK